MQANPSIQKPNQGQKVTSSTGTVSNRLAPVSLDVTNQVKPGGAMAQPPMPIMSQPALIDNMGGMGAPIHNILGEKIELYFSASNLANKDIIGKSDPQLSLYNTSYYSGPKTSLIGKTENIINNLNPHWKTPIETMYCFERHQYLVLIVSDVDSGDDDIVGEGHLELAHVMQKGKAGFAVDLRLNGKLTGSVHIRFEKVPSDLCEYIMEFSATDVKNVEAMACCSTSSPFMRFYRPSDTYLNNSSPTIPEHEWIQVHETEHCPGNLNPTFKQFTIASAKLCKNNGNTTCKVELWARGNSGLDKKISTGFFTPNNFVNNKQPVT